MQRDPQFDVYLQVGGLTSKIKPVYLHMFALRASAAPKGTSIIGRSGRLAWGASGAAACLNVSSWNPADACNSLGKIAKFPTPSKKMIEQSDLNIPYLLGANNFTFTKLIPNNPPSTCTLWGRWKAASPNKCWKFGGKLNNTPINVFVFMIYQFIKSINIYNTVVMVYVALPCRKYHGNM